MSKSPRIESAYAHCLDVSARRRVHISRRKMIAVHRCGMGEDAGTIAERYRSVLDARRATGGRMPYAFVIRRDGVIEQSALVTEVTPHVRVWNAETVGIALVGDFRAHLPSQDQYESLVWLCTRLAACLSATAHIWGHDELNQSSGDTRKQCPGAKLVMDDVRALVAEAAPRILADEYAIQIGTD